jgi:arylamine N-acetyltransferase
LVQWFVNRLALSAGPHRPYLDLAPGTGRADIEETTMTVTEPPRCCDGAPTPDRATIDAYLDRLGLVAEAPSVEALARLHRAHVERVPYETFWIHLTEGWDIDATASMARIAAGGRGGYCYQLNGAFALLLDHLGYRVTRHVAGVHGPDGPSLETLTNHVALIVNDLPTEANRTGRWYVDTGLGDALYEPLPLVAGTYRQGPMQLVLSETTDGVGQWHFRPDPSGTLAGVSITAEPVGLDAFVARHTYNATSPESSFARTVTAQRCHATGVDAIRGCVLTRRDGGTTSTITFETCAEWLVALDEVFGLRLTAPTAAIESLWTRVRRTHDEWLAASPPTPNLLQ